jgi:hypothetical protein
VGRRVGAIGLGSGLDDGLGVGRRVGNGFGRSVGLGAGLGVGLAVGRRVGAGFGRGVGLGTGLDDGLGVGRRVGKGFGRRVGLGVVPTFLNNGSLQPVPSVLIPMTINAAVVVVGASTEHRLKWTPLITLDVAKFASGLS